MNKFGLIVCFSWFYDLLFYEAINICALFYEANSNLFCIFTKVELKRQRQLLLLPEKINNKLQLSIKLPIKKPLSISVL